MTDSGIKMAALLSFSPSETFICSFPVHCHASQDTGLNTGKQIIIAISDNLSLIY